MIRKVFTILIALPLFAKAQKLAPPENYLKNVTLSSQARTFFKNLELLEKDPGKFYMDPGTEALTSSIMDSVLAKETDLRPFYLYLTNRHLMKVNGDLLPIALQKVYKVLETDPLFFFSFMAANPEESKLYLGKWANMLYDYGTRFCVQIQHKEKGFCLRSLKASIDSRLLGYSDEANKVSSEFFSQFGILAPELPPLVIRKEYAGMTFTISTVKPIQAVLRECRGCASKWQISKEDLDKVSIEREEFSNPSCTDCTGGEQDHSIYFKILRPGPASITFSYFKEKLTINFNVE